MLQLEFSQIASPIPKKRVERHYTLTNLLATLRNLVNDWSALRVASFCTFPNIEGTGHSARAMQDGMLEEIGVVAIAGTSFGAFGEGFLRFSCANSAANIDRAIDRMADWLAA